MILHGSVNYL